MSVIKDQELSIIYEKINQNTNREGYLNYTSLWDEKYQEIINAFNQIKSKYENYQELELYTDIQTTINLYELRMNKYNDYINSYYDSLENFFDVDNPKTKKL